MEWKHKCSLDWLRERQIYLTASDIHSLVPLTKTGRPRKITDVDRMKILASKNVTLTEDDCWSYGAAARGHIMEPYAIDALNQTLKSYHTGEQFYHWDDKLISLPDRSIAFSPDAMDITQEDHAKGENPHAIAEVKCYSIDRHISTALSKKNEIEERWQIATAMSLLDTIDHAYLTLFNPSLNNSMKLVVIRFDRSELEDEITMIHKIELDWVLFKLTGIRLPGQLLSTAGKSELQIMTEYRQSQNLNP